MLGGKRQGQWPGGRTSVLTPRVTLKVISQSYSSSSVKTPVLTGVWLLVVFKLAHNLNQSMSMSEPCSDPHLLNSSSHNTKRMLFLQMSGATDDVLIY